MNMASADYEGTDDGSDHIDHHNRPHNFSMLSLCSSFINGECNDDEDGAQMGMYMSSLSMESFDADEEDEFSDEKGRKGLPEHSSDSEKEPAVWFSLPAIPRRQKTRGRGDMSSGVKDYAGENDARNGGISRRKTGRNWRRRSVSRSERSYGGGGFSGDSEGGGGVGVVVITRPKGGRRSLCMNLEEVKACRDLGFELEHERMVEMPSSGGDSPIASPGDDPRDVKARLKVWAQAVALASAAR